MGKFNIITKESKMYRWVHLYKEKEIEYICTSLMLLTRESKSCGRAESYDERKHDLQAKPKTEKENALNLYICSQIFDIDSASFVWWHDFKPGL